MVDRQDQVVVRIDDHGLTVQRTHVHRNLPSA
jgi:hypothetical protein